MNTQVFTLQETAQLLRLPDTPGGRRVVRELCKAGKLGNETVNRRNRYTWLFRQSDIDAFLAGPKYKTRTRKSKRAGVAR